MKYREYLEHNEEMPLTFKGTSMLPMLDAQHDIVIVRRKGAERLKKDDVGLFFRNGRYVLHRVIAVYADRYDFMGDNCMTGESGVMEDDVLGVMIAFEHRGVKRTPDDPEYLAYVRRINRTRKARVFLKRTKCRLAKLKHRIFGRGK